MSSGPNSVLVVGGGILDCCGHDMENVQPGA